ncbi:MAG: tetratricopeptide (TPR) repeat protein [Saprospiraceae bacterium]|jgi:tetratricopeptide (TPR) repeat protein
MGWKQVILIVSALSAVVLLYILPTPNANYRTIELEKKSEEGASLSNEEKIEKALKIMQGDGGGTPMEGIGLLKAVVANDPSNEQALFYLGDFSLKTSQFEKAIPRFLKLTELNPEAPQYWYLLAQAYEMNKNSDKAVNAYQTFINFNTDSIIIEDVRNRIKTLKK